MVWPEVLFLPSAHRPHRFHRSHRPHKYHRPRDPTDLTGPTDTTDPTDPGLGFRGLNTDGHTLDGSQWGSSPLPLSPSITIVLLGHLYFCPETKRFPLASPKHPSPHHKPPQSWLQYLWGRGGTGEFPVWRLCPHLCLLYPRGTQSPMASPHTSLPFLSSILGHPHPTGVG